MFEPRTLLDSIQQRLPIELDRHPPQPDRFYTLTLPLPGFRLQTLIQAGPRWCFWGKPNQEEYRLGAGEALRLSASGQDRFRQLSAFFQDILTKWDRFDPDHTHIEPVLFTGFAFSQDDPMSVTWEGMPNAALCLPKVLLQQQGNSCTLSCSFDTSAKTDLGQLIDDWMAVLSQLIEAAAQPPGPPGHRTNLLLIHSEPSKGEWLSWVHKAKQDIAKGLIEKVVLARQIHVRAERQLNTVRLMSTLGCLYPDSVLFASRQENLTFAAASPEHLLSCRNATIRSDAVAGTLPRAADETKDRLLGQALLDDPKSQHEHQLVVENIQAVLRAICSDVHPIKPLKLKRLRALQHLWSELSGTLKPDIGLFEAAEQLHPTAAVNGTPVQQARLWLQQNESLSRGWYTGAAGWIDANGDGELAVLIRCVQLQGYDAELYAGAGITDGSDPEGEYEETELKLGAMLEALEEA